MDPFGVPDLLSEIARRVSDLRDASVAVAFQSTCRSFKAVLPYDKAYYTRSDGLGGPCAFAMEAGDLDVLQWLRDKGCPWSELGCSLAARRGHLHVLQWAIAHGAPINKDWICAHAAHGGHLRVIEWLASLGCELHNIFYKAACGGHLHVLQWGEERSLVDFKSSDICLGAIRAGRLDILEWAWARSHDVVWHADVYTSAAEEGHVHILQWAHDNECPVHGDENACYYAAVKDQIPALQWLLAHGFHWNFYDLMDIVARDCSLATLQWLWKTDCPRDPAQLVTAASLIGRLDMVQWLYAQGCPLHSNCFIPAASNLEILKWLYENKCPWSNAIMSIMGANGSVDGLRWLRSLEPPTPWDPSSATKQRRMAIWKSFVGLGSTVAHGNETYGSRRPSGGEIVALVLGPIVIIVA